MLSRPTPFRSLVSLAVLAAGCAAGDDIANPTSAGPGAGGRGSDGTGGGGDGGSSGAETTTSNATSSSSSSGTGAPTSSSTSTGSGDGGAPSGPGGGGPDGGGGSAGEGGGGGSPPLPECGDGELNGTEDCEGADLGGATCTNIGQGFIGGDLACTGACELDTSGCTAPPDCGNGVIEGVEECDGAQLGGATCQTEGYQTGTIGCTAGCVLDVGDCSTCGNDTIEADEVCDGTALGGATCVNLGHDGGTLSCNGTCSALVQTACSDCGDGQIEAPEACDGSNFGGATCASLGFTAGTLACTSNCTNVSTANCYTCGDGQITGAEVCDGSQFGGVTCQSLGFELGGTLTCNAGCLSRNTSQCVDSQCNDGIDNDGDGFVDLADLGCTSAADASENRYAEQCAGNGNPIFDTGYPQFSVSYYQPFSTVGFPNVNGAPCQANTGPEIWFVYRSEQAQPDIWFYTQPPVGSPPNGQTSMTDTVITVYRDTCNSGTFVCDDDSGDGNHARAIVTNVDAGELLFIKVEGWNGAAGYGELVVDLFFNNG